MPIDYPRIEDFQALSQRVSALETPAQTGIGIYTGAEHIEVLLQEIGAGGALMVGQDEAGFYLAPQDLGAILLKAGLTAKQVGALAEALKLAAEDLSGKPRVILPVPGAFSAGSRTTPGY